MTKGSPGKAGSERATVGVGRIYLTGGKVIAYTKSMSITTLVVIVGLIGALVVGTVVQDDHGETIWDACKRLTSRFTQKAKELEAPPPRVTFLGTSEDGEWDVAVFDTGLIVRRRVFQIDQLRRSHPAYWVAPGGGYVSMKHQQALEDYEHQMEIARDQTRFLSLLEGAKEKV